MSPHTALLVREPDLACYLVYDRYERRSALIHLRDAAEAGPLGPEAMAAESVPDLSDTADGVFAVIDLDARSCTLKRETSVSVEGDRIPLTVTKRVRLEGDRLTPVLTVEVELDAGAMGGIAVELDLEWNLNLLGGGGNPQAWYELEDWGGASPMRLAHNSRGDRAAVRALAFGNDHLGVAVQAILEPPCRVTWFPIETVSSSEAGFERIYQGSSLHLRWPIMLGEGPTGAAVRFEARQAFDLSEI